MDRKEVERRFLDDTLEHQMGIALNDGVFRHITFKRPGSSAYHFNITTWPGYLCISGDMGCFVFSRLRDMFEFFGEDKDINPQYWAEKLQAQNRSGHKEFSEEKYQKILREQFELWDFKNDTQKQEAWENIENELFDENDIDAAYRYVCQVTRQEFVNLWDHNFDDYTFHYLWCCYAIRWGIEKFREKIPVVEGELS